MINMNHLNKEVHYKILKVSSAAFRDQQPIHSRYTCDGINISPPLLIENIAADAISLAIIVDDPDAPAGTWVHWIMWNIPVTHHIKEASVPGLEGKNDFKVRSYRGPCPPPGGVHHYFFKVYALDCLLHLPADTTKHQLEKAMGGHILAFGELIGLYSRTKQKAPMG